MYIIVASYHNTDSQVFLTNQTLDEIDQEWTPKFQWDDGYEMSFEEGDGLDVYELNTIFPTEPLELKSVAFMDQSATVINSYYLHRV